QLIIPHLVQYPNELLFCLAVDLIKLNAYRRFITQNMAVKKIRAFIKSRKHIPFLVFGHGWQLEHITNEQNLDTPKPFIGTLPDMTQNEINRIKCITPHHADLIAH